MVVQLHHYPKPTSSQQRNGQEINTQMGSLRVSKSFSLTFSTVLKLVQVDQYYLYKTDTNKLYKTHNTIYNI